MVKALLRLSAASFKIFVSHLFLVVVGLLNRALFDPQWVGLILKFWMWHLHQWKYQMTGGIVKRSAPRFCALVLQLNTPIASAIESQAYHRERALNFPGGPSLISWALKSTDPSPEPGAGRMWQRRRKSEGRLGQNRRSEPTETAGALQKPWLVEIQGTHRSCERLLAGSWLGNRPLSPERELRSAYSWNELESVTQHRASKKKCRTLMLAFGIPSKRSSPAMLHPDLWSAKTEITTGHGFQPFWWWSVTTGIENSYPKREIRVSLTYFGHSSRLPCTWAHNLSLLLCLLLLARLSITSLLTALINRFYVLSYSPGLTNL